MVRSECPKLGCATGHDASKKISQMVGLDGDESHGTIHKKSPKNQSRPDGE